MSGFFRGEIRVPLFQQYFPSEEDMDGEQRRFYRTWVKNWSKGRPLDVKGNISYLCCYVYKMLAFPPAKASLELIRLIEAYPGEEKFLEYCKSWLSDCYVLLGDYRKALDVYPPIRISSRGATCTDDILSLKLQIGEHVAGRDILTLNGPNVTEWGKEHLDQVATYLDVIVCAYEKHNNVNLLEKWKTSSHQYPYSVFRGTFLSASTDVPCYSFSLNEEVIEFIGKRTRDAENSVRDEMSIPRVGEGWISETELYYELCHALPDAQVLHHARPEWLGRQHLDIFIPEYAVAVEFQGVQHDEPVAYFGGEQAFQASKRRDATKKRMCTKNGVRLIRIRPGYDLHEIVREISEAANDREGRASSN